MEYPDRVGLSGKTTMTLNSFVQRWTVCFSCLLFANVVTAQKEDTSFRCNLIEETPEFSGGMAALMKYLSTHLKYAPGNDDWQLCGRIVARFVVNKSGRTEQVTIVKGCGNAELEAAVIKLIRDMPAWKPGRSNGKAIDCDYTLPVLIHWSE